MSYSTVEAAGRARLESKKLPFKGETMQVCQFESKQTRLAHIEEVRDKRRLESYKELMKPSAEETARMAAASNSQI